MWYLTVFVLGKEIDLTRKFILSIHRETKETKELKPNLRNITEVREAYTMTNETMKECG